MLAPLSPHSYAPEHLIVNVEDAEAWLPLLDNAGSVFLGRYTPESVGDYASGEAGREVVGLQLGGGFLVTVQA